MDITIGKFDPDTKTVPVKFEHGGVTHERNVNAVFDEDGKYDKVETKKRVDAVALGVANKIDIGAIKNATPPEPPPVVK